MKQATGPTIDTCSRLLGAMPAMAAFRRAIRESAPPDTLGWLGTLMVVHRHPAGVRPSAVAEVLHLDLSVVSRSIAQLEQLGLAARVKDPADGRASIVTLTTAGTARADELGQGFAEHVATLLEDWSDEDVAAFADYMVRFHATLERREVAR